MLEESSLRISNAFHLTSYSMQSKSFSLAFKALLKGLSYPKSPQFLLIFYYCPAQPLGDQSVHQPSPRAVYASCQSLITSHVPGWHSLIKGPTSPPSPDWLLLPGHSGLSEIS